MYSPLPPDVVVDDVSAVFVGTWGSSSGLPGARAVQILPTLTGACAESVPYFLCTPGLCSNCLSHNQHVAGATSDEKNPARARALFPGLDPSGWFSGENHVDAYM